MIQKRIMVRILTTMLALILICGMAACGSEKNNQPDTTTSESTSFTGTNTETTNTDVPKDPVTITALLSSDVIPPDDNIVLQEICNRTGINFKPTVVPVADVDTKLNALISSGSLPDIIKSVNSVKIKEMAKNDVLVALDQYLEEYGKNILENKGDYLKGNCSVDGKIFALPCNGIPNCPMLALRKDWLDNLNMEVPTNRDEYYEVLKAFTKNDPDKDKKPNTIGLGVRLGSTVGDTAKTFSHIFASYGIAISRPNYVDGKVIPEILHPGYLDAIKYINKLYHEGLIEPDFATIPVMQGYEKLWNGIYGAFDAAPSGMTNNWLPRYKDPNTELVYTIIKGPEGHGGALKYILDDNNFVGVTSSCENPGEAVRLLDFLCSEEGDELAYLGIKGKHYDWNTDGSIKYLPPYDTDQAAQRNDGGFIYSQMNYRLRGAAYKIWNKVTRDAVDLMLSSAIDDAYTYEKPAIELDTGTLLEDMLRQTFVSLVTSKGDLDKEYQDFVNKYLESGGNRWIEQATEIYRKQEGIN